MVTYRGYQTAVQYDEETSYGSGAAPATEIKGRISTLTVNMNNTLIRTQGLGEGRNETNVLYGNFDGTWSMEYELGQPDFLQFGIGSMAGSGSTAAPYYLKEEEFMDYTATAAFGLKSFGLEIASMDKTGGTHAVDTLSGCVINTIGLNIALGQTLKCSVEGFYKTITSGTSATAYTANTDKPWIFAAGNFKWNGSAIARVTSAAININNNFDPEVGRELGSRFVTAAEPGLRKYDWVLTVKMTSAIATTLRDHFYGQVNTPITGVLDPEPTFYAIILDFSEGGASGDRQLQVKLSNCAINDISKPINIGDNIVELTLNGTAKNGTTDTTNRPIIWYATT
jgi:hypothetical protein